MAKDRKHDSSDRHDRLLGTYGYVDYGSYMPSTGQTDLNEHDIWLSSGSYQGSSEYWPQAEPDQANPSGQSNRTNDRGRADRHRHVGGLSSAFEDRYGAGPAVFHQNRGMDGPSSRHVAAASAPVNVPVWSKMVRAESSDSMSGSVELDRDESDWVPPHEYLARAHGENVTTSVVEGVGRTLKGRDMSRVRDAVWSQTGFSG